MHYAIEQHAPSVCIYIAQWHVCMSALYTQSLARVVLSLSHDRETVGIYVYGTEMV